MSNKDLVGLCQVHTESFGLAHEEVQERDHWRLKMKGEPANYVCVENGHENGACVCVYAV